MSQYDIGKWARTLPYPLKENEYAEFTPSPIGTPNVVTPNFFNPDTPNDKVDIKISISLNELTAIASAVDVGRDIAYGEQSFDLWRTWCQIFMEKIIVSCEDVADCIDNDEATQSAIANAITINEMIQNAVIQQLGGMGNPNHVNPTRTRISDRNLPQSLDETVVELEDCDLDTLWGGIREIVARIDDIARDMLEDLANINDVVQRYQAFIDIVPILGDVAEAVVTAATELIPDIMNAYNAHSSETVLDEIACDLFEMVCAECRYPTYNEIMNYYATLGYEMSDMDAMTTALLVSKLSQMMAGVVVPEVIYFSTTSFALFTLYLQATFNGKSGTRTLGTWAKLGFPSNNWFDLCDTCNEQYMRIEYDFTQSSHGFYPDAADGTPDEGFWVAGKGFRIQNVVGGQRAEIAGIINPSYKFHSVAWHSTQTGLLSARSMCLRPLAGSTASQVCANQYNGSGDFTGYNCVDGMNGQTGYNEIAFAAQLPNQAQSAYIDKLIFIVEAPNAPAGAQPTADNTICV